jgi:hypothetical protein
MMRGPHRLHYVLENGEQLTPRVEFPGRPAGRYGCDGHGSLFDSVTLEAPINQPGFLVVLTGDLARRPFIS